MRALITPAVIALAVAIAHPALAGDGDGDGDGDGAAPADDAGEPPPPVTDVWREPKVPLELHWHLLALPERAVELAFTPLAMIVRTFERYRLDRRIADLLRNDEGTIALDPKVKLSFGDGLGVGGTLKLRSLLAAEDTLNVSALTRVNRDYEVGIRRRQAFAAMEGRELDLRLDYEVDRNLRWYGLGNDTAEADERVVRTNAFTASADLDLTARGAIDVRGKLTVSYRHQSMAPGEDPAIDAAGAMGDSVGVPADFDTTLDIPEVKLSLVYDTRDTEGRPRTGWYADVHGSVMADLGGEPVNAMTGGAEVYRFVPLLPRHRTLVLGAGTTLSAPLTTDGQVPLHALAILGRENHLTGYGKARFRDRYGWWSEAEYQYPIYEYMETGITLSTTVFFEVGRVAGKVSDAFTGPLRYSYGVGLRGAHDSRRILTVHLGFSPEGIQAAFSLGAGI